MQTLNFPISSIFDSSDVMRGNMIWKLALIPLKLAVYSNSKFLVMTWLSLYGAIEGIARVPKKRLNAIKSLLDYAVTVLQRGL